MADGAQFRKRRGLRKGNAGMGDLVRVIWVIWSHAEQREKG